LVGCAYWSQPEHAYRHGYTGSGISGLAVPDQWLTVAYVMVAQALSGIAKDLNKMSVKTMD